MSRGRSLPGLTRCVRTWPRVDGRSLRSLYSARQPALWRVRSFTVAPQLLCLSRVALHVANRWRIHPSQGTVAGSSPGSVAAPGCASPGADLEVPQSPPGRLPLLALLRRLPPSHQCGQRQGAGRELLLFVRCYDNTRLTGSWCCGGR
jgi:hypothetical protein